MNLKKILNVMLFGAMCMGFVSCENDEPGGNNNGNGTEQTDQGNQNGNGSGGGDNGSGSGDYSSDTKEAVDLGLPSGTLWATCNVGAEKPEEYGNYYAWGEVDPKTYYEWSRGGDYKWGVYNDSDTENYGMTKYNTTDGKTVLDLEDDTAHVNWGGDWRMPTKAEMDELCNNCTWTWTTDYNGTGVAGHIVTSELNGNSIFLPAAGYRSNSSLYNAGEYGYYWSSSLLAICPDYAYYLFFYSNNYGCGRYGRYFGVSVRAVCSAR